MEKEKKKSKKIPIILGILFMFCIGIYVGVAVYFQDYFLPNTVINGMDVSGRTWSDVQSELESKINSYELVINTRNDITDKITTADIAMKTDFGDSIKNAQAEQNKWLWPKSLFEGQTVTFESELSYSDEMLDDVISKMNCMDEEQAAAPKDARVSKYKSGKGYHVIAEKENNRLKTDVFKSIVVSALNGLETEISADTFEEADAYEHPEIYSDNEELVKFVEQANKLVNVELTYRFGESEEVVNGDIIKDWLTKDDDGNVVIDPALAREYVNTLARRYETFGSSSRSFKTSYGRTISVEGGDYGWWMNRSTTTDELVAAVEAGENKEMEAVFYQKAASFEGNDYGSTYVEINITAQHLFLYKDGQCIFETDFVSGKPSIKNTPSGVYPITYKERAHTMTGDASDPYRVETSFWMPFCGGVGMHDATWRTSFGGTLYKTGGSHGCVNLPYNAAKTIYNTVSIGTPVIVYRLSGTEKSSTTSQGDKEIANIGIDAIDRISTIPINLDYYEQAKDRIEWARQVYTDLSAAQRKLVTNYQNLVDAEKKLKALK